MGPTLTIEVTIKLVLMYKDVDALQADTMLVYKHHTSSDPGQSTARVAL